MESNPNPLAALKFTEFLLVLDNIPSIYHLNVLDSGNILAEWIKESNGARMSILFGESDKIYANRLLGGKSIKNEFTVDKIPENLFDIFVT